MALTIEGCGGLNHDLSVGSDYDTNTSTIEIPLDDRGMLPVKWT